jgi:hypothetical protein
MELRINGHTYILQKQNILNWHCGIRIKSLRDASTYHLSRNSLSVLRNDYVVS